MRLKHFSFYLIAISSMFIFAGCGKDDTKTPATDYAPMTASSTWTYQTAPSGTYTLTSTNRDTTINGKTFHVFTNTNSNVGNNYMGKSGNDYYRFGILPGIAPTGFDETYLKDNLDVNGTWVVTQNATAPGIPTPIPVNLTYTITEKGVQKVVSGTTYSNVIHVKLNISALGISGGNGDFYYSGGVGLIESTLVINANPAFGIQASNQTQTLTNYSIK
jgi:hypothetical protein